MSARTKVDYITEATDNQQLIRIPRHFGKYTYVRTLGTGASSVVVLCQEDRTGRQFAAKAVDRQVLVREEKFGYFEREVRLLETIDHPSIVKLFQTIYLEEVIILIMEYCPNGDLFEYLTARGAICLATTRSFLYQLFKGIAYLHERKLAHRDLKLENIFLDGQYRLKIGDLGLAKQVEGDNLFGTICGTLFYTPPEIIRNEEYDGLKADVWSLGIIAYTLAVGALPWTSRDCAAIEREILAGEIHVPEYVSDPLTRLIMDCTRPNPAERPTVSELLETEWLRSEEAQWQKYAARNLPAATSRFASTTKVMWAPQEKGSPQRRVLVRPIKATNSERLMPGKLFLTRTADVLEPHGRTARIKMAPSAKLVRLNKSFM